MKYHMAKGVSLSALSLGTVQLGMEYGIANKTGKPSEDLAFQILNSAIEGGITSLDTAAAYGNSEDVIGSWLKTIPVSKQPFITTKAKHLDHSSFDTLRSSLMAEVESSKKRLGLDQIPLLMLHSCDEYIQSPDSLKEIFDELKETKQIRFSGISAYAHHDYQMIAESGFDAVQIPVNVFDWRQIDNGGIAKLRDAGMMIFVRSVFLQGLVFQDPDHLPKHMQFCKETLVTFRELCRSFGMEPATLALSYALSLPGVTSLVLGSETPEQVRSNLDMMESVRDLTSAEMEELHQAFKNVEDHMLNPSLWNPA